MTVKQTIQRPGSNLPISEQITVFKLDESGRKIWRYPGRVLAREERSIRLEAFFDRETADLGPVVFQRGDRFVETFYTDRWYNVFAVYDGPEGSLKGWYCNICRPAEIDECEVRCEDLALDVWIAVSGDVHVMDEDEFAALNIKDESRRMALAALERILQLAAAGQLPA